MAQKYKQRKDTFESLQSLENETLERQMTIKVKIEESNSERENILLRLAESDTSAAADLRALDENVSRLHIELQSLDVLLKTLPARRDFVQGEEIESVVPKIEQLIADVPTLVDEIKSKLSPLISAIQDFHIHLENFGGIKGFEGLGLVGQLFSTGMNAIHVPSPGVVSDAEPIHTDLILIAAFFNEDKSALLIERIQATIAERLEKLRDHAQRLKGKSLPAPRWAYCPGCYENMNGGPDNQGRCHCSKCGKTFAAEKIPGMIVHQGS